MGGSVTRSNGRAPVNRFDEVQGEVKKIDPRLGDLTMAMAKAHLGGAVDKAITLTKAPLKEFGDPGQVSRVCEGEVSVVLARVWAREDTRRVWLLDLIDKSGLFEVHTEIRARR